ncbi:citrate synthase [Aspergillus vadensis CBS 113365]|uniref:Citrate synthase n=1 Tax=Aspergillus vadensis (strain CBS 113365 / IMI 142717 / IBT 24658) TaxID=1448311 RepID=A0A319BS96_ASPVC|nr:citrate synthase [Aspergillus vadensis CBS 113365]PYH74369.1 citrate synthase [Aspergillus vadensis CBS 113365]
MDQSLTDYLGVLIRPFELFRPRLDGLGQTAAATPDEVQICASEPDKSQQNQDSSSDNPSQTHRIPFYIMAYTLVSWLGRLFDAGKSLLPLQGNYINALLEQELPGEREGTLTVRDNRTGSKYTIPIVRNSVPAMGFRQICVDRAGKSPRQQFEDGLRLIDPGYRNTAVKMSSITYINGNEGVILYRGHPLASLIGKSYEEITHLLIWGSLPTPEERLRFQRRIAEAMMVVPENVKKLVATFPRNTPPMVILCAVLTGYLADQPELIPAHAGANLYNRRPEMVDEQIIRTLAVTAIAGSIAHCHMKGEELRAADPNLSYIENILWMGRYVDNNAAITREKAAEILTKAWSLYADHEMTNSTSAFLHVSSSLADPLSAMAACCMSGYGLLHGGAIDAAYRGMREIGGPENVPKLIEKVINKECRLSGYGHRIYKQVDPRAKYVREMLDELTRDRDIREMDPVLQVAMEIDRIASTHEYFVKRNLQANADLYGSFVYTALGIDSQFATVLAATARVSGVMAHWKEQTERAPDLWRPLQVYVPN